MPSTRTTKKPLSYYLGLEYPFKVVANQEGGYVIEFPDLPGCITQGDSVEEIGAVAEEARRLWITTEYEEGEEIPLPSHPEEYSGKFNVRLPRSLHRRLVALAEREGVSLNQCVLALLSRAEAEVAYSRSFPGNVRETEPEKDKRKSFKSWKFIDKSEAPPHVVDKFKRMAQDPERHEAKVVCTACDFERFPKTMEELLAACPECGSTQLALDIRMLDEDWQET